MYTELWTAPGPSLQPSPINGCREGSKMFGEERTIKATSVAGMFLLMYFAQPQETLMFLPTSSRFVAVKLHIKLHIGALIVLDPYEYDSRNHLWGEGKPCV